MTARLVRIYLSLVWDEDKWVVGFSNEPLFRQVPTGFKQKDLPVQMCHLTFPLFPTKTSPTPPFAPPDPPHPGTVVRKIEKGWIKISQSWNLIASSTYSFSCENNCVRQWLLWNHLKYLLMFKLPKAWVSIIPLFRTASIKDHFRVWSDSCWCYKSFLQEICKI